jgi:hypothetical protein
VKDFPQVNIMDLCEELPSPSCSAYSILTLTSGSGASNANSASTTDNSSRLSAVSTAPSSTDAHGREDWKAHQDKQNVPLPPIPKSNSSGFLKNAGRSLSWGRSKNNSVNSSPKMEPPSPPIHIEEPAARTRAMTTSSYASTATPPKLESKSDLGLSLGGDFSDMFAGLGNRKSVVMEAENNRGHSQSPVCYSLLLNLERNLTNVGLDTTYTRYPIK